MKSRDFLLVVLQFLLFILFAIIPSGFGPPFLPAFLTFAMTIAGILIITFSIAKLNKNLTVFPTPVKNGSLETGGLYKFVRHPVYSGIILTTLGIALYSASYPRLIITGVLFLLFLYKSSYEEKMLGDKFPDYSAYKQKTGKFFPKLISSQKRK